VEKNKISRSAIDDGDVRYDTVQGKHAEELREKAYDLLRKGGVNINKVKPETIEDWIAEQIKEPSKKREFIRERNKQLLKDFGKGGKFEGHRLDPKALFKDDELEEVAFQPGGIVEAMSMKSSIPTVIGYLRHLQSEGYETYSGLDYKHVKY
jgi:hypothetical protein